MLVPRLPPTAKTAILRKSRTVHVRGSKSRLSPAASPRPRTPRVSDAELDREQATETHIMDSAPILDLPTVEEELKILPELDHSMRRLDEIVNAMGQVNNSAIVCDTQIVRHTGKLLRKFRPFYNEAIKYFTAVKELKENGALKDGSNIVPIAELKRVAYEFVDKWKGVVGILNVIKENGMSSLAHYITVKARSIDYAILDITTTNRRNSVHEEALLNCGGKLRQLLHNLDSGLQSLLIHTSLVQAKADLMKTHVNDVKSFVRVYNDAHIHEFPKSGFCSVDLLQFKSQVMAACNDIIKAIQVAFSFSNDIDELFSQVEAVQDMLKVTIERLNLPQTIVRYVIKSRKSARDRPPPKPVENPLDEYVDGQEVSVVVCARIDEFVENVQVRMGLPFDSPTMTVWQRLDRLQESLNDRIDGMKTAEHEVELLRQQVDEQSKEIEALLIRFAEEKSKDEEIEKSLNQQISSLQDKFEASEQERQKAEETITKKKKRIQNLISRNVEELNQELIHHIGDRMNALMERQRDIDVSAVGENCEGIQRVDKMNLFVIEKRCSKCQKFEEMRKRIKEALQGVVDFEKGETVEEAIMQFKEKVLAAREMEKEKAEQMVEEEEETRSRELDVEKMDVGVNTMQDDMKSVEVQVTPAEPSVSEHEKSDNESIISQGEEIVASEKREQEDIIEQKTPREKSPRSSATGSVKHIESDQLSNSSGEKLSDSFSAKAEAESMGQVEVLEQSESSSKEKSKQSKASSKAKSTDSDSSSNEKSAESDSSSNEKSSETDSSSGETSTDSESSSSSSEDEETRKPRSTKKATKKTTKKAGRRKSPKGKNDHDAEMKRQQEEMQREHEQLKKKHEEELREERERLLQQQFDILQEISNSMLQDCSEAGSKSCADVKALILKKLKILANNLHEANSKIEFQRDLLSKVEKWMNKMTEYTTEGMPIEKALTLMMEAMEMRPSQFASQISKLQADATYAQSEVERCVAKVRAILETDQSSSPRGVKTICQNTTIMSRGLDKIAQMITDSKYKIRNLENELTEARQGLVDSTEKLATTLDHQIPDLRNLNITSLVLQTQLCIDELIGSSGTRHFIAVTELNKQTKEARKSLRMKASNSPAVYLPILSKRVIGITTILRYTEQFTTPLDAIFESLDFKMEPVDPHAVPYPIIREQLFRMHGLIGKIPDTYVNRTVIDIIRRLVLISSMLLTCVAALDK